MMRYVAFLAVLLVLVTAIFSCKKKSAISKIPVIGLVNMQPDHIKLTNAEDTLYLLFNIADGDADLGNVGSPDVYMIDSRAADTMNVNTDTVKLNFPDIPEKALNPDKGAEGQLLVPLWSGNLHMRDDQRDKDTLTYEIYIVDKAGNKSNHVTTPTIYLEQ